MKSIEKVIKSMRYGAHKGSYEPILKAWAEVCRESGQWCVL